MGLSTTYAVGVGIVVMCAVGLYGILKKKQWPLIVVSYFIIIISMSSSGCKIGQPAVVFS